MKLRDIILIASKAYSNDGLVARNFNPKTGHATINHHGDGLANFIVRELVDTYDPKASNSDQLLTAVHAMARARDQLNLVRNAFEDAPVGG